MKLVIITDAWEPQINGVVQTLKNLILQLKKIILKLLLFILI